MKFEKKYAGKWVAIKNNKAIKSGKILINLIKEMKKIKGRDNLWFALIPNGLIAG